jgi:tRNA modification GTPase
MLVEATLDFPEEEIDFLQKADAKGQLDRIQATLQTVFSRASQGALLREGIQVVIAGQPNAGKSSLLNALAGAELAIVTPIAGTTRDRVQETIQVEGVPIHVIDTAGLRASEDTVEKIGIARAWEAIAAADVVLFLHDLTRIDQTDYQAGESEIAAMLLQKLPRGVPVLDVWNKTDAVAAAAARAGGITLSAKTGAGLDALRQSLLRAAGWQAPAGGSYIARERHLQALRRVEVHCSEAAAHLVSQAQALDLLAEELRLAQTALSDITGEFSSDDLLGVIFSQFCIGK